MAFPLHVHSWYSLLEGASSLEQLLEKAVACGYSALALTDTNNLYGAVPFAQLAQRYGIRPIFGVCLKQRPYRAVALIADRAGYSSACRIISRLNLSTEAVSLADLLAENATGLHVLVQDLALAESLRDAFGSRLWLELVRPAHSPREEQELLAGAEKLGLRVVASTAAHFAAPADYDTFRLTAAVKRCGLLDQLPRSLGITPAHHLVDTTELRNRFRDLPDAVANTERLAEQLQSAVLPHEVVLPRPRVPRSFEASTFRRALCERGLRRRNLGEDLAARERLRAELAVIEAGDLAGYFLIVRATARYARSRRLSMALRGSAGNSLVCYLLEITEVDPLRFRLPLERFLHPGRADLPDIDLDFDWKVRDEVIAHVFRRYGAAHTAMISSHLFLQPRSAFREAAKVHGLSNEQISSLLEVLADRVSTFIVPDAAADPPLPPRFPLEAERWPRIVADARKLLGRPQHLSIHPGGVVITPRPIENYVPLQRAPKGIVITQFDKDGAEYTGLVKIDLLGNRALATVDAIRGQLASAPQRNQSALDDGRTIALLQRGDTLGVNQLESPAMRHLLIQMQPRNVEDVIQALAMIRPGAASVGMKELYIRRRRGLEPVQHFHPKLAKCLEESHGLMVFEDDALTVIQALTGWAGPEADRFRKRIAKHKTLAEAAELTEEFMTACERNHTPRAVAGELWVQLAKFNQYSFCKSHAVSYGLIAWQAATFKAHYPTLFWVAALNNNQGMYPRRVYVEAIKRAGIELYLPCVNRSGDCFTVEGDGIRSGLEAIASLPAEIRETIQLSRRQHGRFRDLEDFRARVNPGPEVLATLIRCGAADCLGRLRPELFLEADLTARTAAAAERLFDDDPAPGWTPADYTRARRIKDEWEILGYVVGPPLLSLFRNSLPGGLHTSRDLSENVGRKITVAGVVATARHTPTSDSRAMQFVTLEDEWGLIETTLFPGTCPPVAYLTLGPYIATGKVEEQYGVLTLTATRFVKAWRD